MMVIQFKFLFARTMSYFYCSGFQLHVDLDRKLLPNYIFFMHFWYASYHSTQLCLCMIGKVMI